LQHVIGCGLQDVETSRACEPWLELLGLKDHRHAVAQLGDELIGFRDNHCA
jgi:hypothetical protein